MIIFAVKASAAAETILGDANCDGAVTVIDATWIQRVSADIFEGAYSEAAADVDGSGVVDISDATLIQKWLAEIETPYAIGTPIAVPEETTIESTTAVPTTAAPTQRPTDEEGWGRDIFRP